MMALPAEFRKRGEDTSQSNTFSSSSRKVSSTYRKAHWTTCM